MLSLLSKRISLFLCGNHVIEKEEIEIYQYGFEIILSSLIGFILSIAVGCCLGMFFYALLYYGIFVILRLFTGGFHANTYLSCNLVFLLVSLSTLGISKIMMYTNIYSIVAHMIIIFISAAVVIKFAPIENENKPLNFEKRIRNQKISRFLIIILSIFACIMFFFMRNIAITIALTLLSVSMLMVVSLIKPKEMKKSEQDQ